MGRVDASEGLVRLLEERLRGLREECVRAVVLFGSLARGEARERSDVDLLVLHEGCGIEDPVKRRRYLYRVMAEALGREFEAITVIDMELAEFVRPKEVTPLLLNIYWDGMVVLDRTGVLREFLSRVRRRISSSGLRRVRDGKAYYWVLPRPLEEVRIL